MINGVSDDQITSTTEWTCADQRRVRICDMTDQHLLNTIRVLRRMSPLGTIFRTTPERRRQWVNAMANEAYARGLTLDALQEHEPVHE